jgi:hypothetical protein
MKGHFGIEDTLCLATQDAISQIYSQFFPQPSPKGLNNGIVDTFNGLMCRINSEINVRRVLLACFRLVTESEPSKKEAHRKAVCIAFNQPISDPLSVVVCNGIPAREYH